MDSPAQGSPRRAHEADRQIPEFIVYELDGGRWQAVHCVDHDLTLEHSDWSELFMACVGVRIRRELDRARDELMERMLRARSRGPQGETRAPGPLGGVNG